MARQKNIPNSKPIEKVDGVYDSLMELDRDIKVEKEKNLKIKQSPIRQSLMAAEKSNFQEGGVKDTIIYPPGDSEYMDQPSYNYDIIEMLNQKDRRGYEQYMHDQTDPTNINRASPAYQQKFQMREGLVSVQDGGIIVDSEGQYSHPGKNTLIPDADGRITMKDVKTPVLGIDDRGNSTVMQPEEEYQFQGNNVLEIPITGDIDSLVDPTRIKAFKKLFSR